MGTDIHCYCEVRGSNKVWTKTMKIFDNPDFDPSKPTVLHNDEGGDWESNEKLTDKPVRSRNYDLFSILANVRNGYGFAGVKTGEGFKPIARPRGLPPDVSQEVKTKSDEWGKGAQFHSYLTVADLISYDWNQVTTKCGIVNEAQFKVFMEKGRPDEWRGGISGQNVRVLSSQVMERRLKSGSPEDHFQGKAIEYYAHVDWKVTYKEAVRQFYEKMLPQLLRLGETYGKDNVRIVFWFDS